MTQEELEEIEGRLSASRHWWGRNIKVGQLNDDIAAMIAGYKELDAEVKQLKGLNGDDNINLDKLWSQLEKAVNTPIEERTDDQKCLLRITGDQ